jgi:very-short-patch-repair endonuclease
MMNSNYNANLQPFANKLRKEMTKAEACLWKYVLRAGKLQGYSFRRQRPISEFIVDFVCFDLKLVIEVDGYSHTLIETQKKDEIKTKCLNKLGFDVLRFDNAEVINNISNVIRRLEEYVDDFERNLHPLPPPAGTDDNSQEEKRNL